MIDPLLFAVLDSVRQQPFGYDERTSAVMDDGKPGGRFSAGTWFLAVHQDGERGDALNSLDEYYDFSLTLTRRLDGIPVDKLGEAALCSRSARTLAKETGFNARLQQLKTFLHMNWWVLGLANNYLVEMYSESHTVNGFCEPAHWESTESPPKFVGGEWFDGDPKATNQGIKAEVRFAGARRLQAIATYE